MVCDGIRGDGFDLYHRLSPLILVTVSLVLPSEQKELLVILIRLILGLEDEQTQQGTQPWGRYIVKATREVLLEFRSVILEGRYRDAEVPLQFLRTTLCNVALLRDGRSPPGYLLVWEPGSVASQHLISSCFFPVDIMLKVIAHRARCKFWANRDAPSSFNVFCDVFVAWDTLHSSWWTRALYSPFTWMPETQEDERRCCHANMLCIESTPTFPIAPTAKAIRAAVVNPYVRCEPKGTGKWVAAHISSLWVPGLKPFEDVHDEDVVTKFMFPGERLSSSRLMIDRPMDFERFSGVLGKMRDGTYLGEVVSQVAMDAVFPYTPYSYLPGFHVKGYFVLPIELSPQRGRISFYTALDVGTEAVFLKTHNDHWSRLVIADNCVSARFRARHPALVIVISRRRGTVGGEFSPSLLGILEYITVED